MYSFWGNKKNNVIIKQFFLNNDVNALYPHKLKKYTENYVKYIKMGQVTKACSLHVFLLHYKRLKVCLKRKKKGGQKLIYRKYKTVPFKVNTAENLSCALVGGLHSLCAFSSLLMSSTSFCLIINELFLLCG